MIDFQTNFRIKLEFSYPQILQKISDSNNFLAQRIEEERQEIMRDESEDDEEEEVEFEVGKVVDSIISGCEDTGKTEDEGYEIATGFNKDEFHSLYEFIKGDLSHGRGRKSAISPVDQLFITLHFLKTYKSSEELSSTFGLKEPSVRSIPKKERRYYDGKHKFHSIKWLCGHYPSGYCVFSSALAPGSDHDYLLLKENKETAISLSKKIEGEVRMQDNGEGSRDYPNNWDKGFVGAGSWLGSIIPKKTKKIPKFIYK